MKTTFPRSKRSGSLCDTNYSLVFDVRREYILLECEMGLEIYLTLFPRVVVMQIQAIPMMPFEYIAFSVDILTYDED